MIVGVDVDHLEDGGDAAARRRSAGLLIVDPDADMRAGFRQRRAEQSEVRQAALPRSAARRLRPTGERFG